MATFHFGKRLDEEELVEPVAGSGASGSFVGRDGEEFEVLSQVTVVPENLWLQVNNALGADGCMVNFGCPWLFAPSGGYNLGKNTGPEGVQKSYLDMK
jgi:hypothetical protein